MKLLSLNLLNFRQHTNTSIQFSNGITGIIGSNGAGKTSLVEAIAFALYGSRAIRGKVDDLRTRGRKREQKMEVSLLFEHDQMTFRIDRGSEDACMYAGGEAKALVSGTREVTARVTALLGMSYEEFSATCFTEQKGLEFLSGKRGAAERERFIVRIMGYDKLEHVQELLRLDRRDKRTTLTALEAGLGKREDIEARLADENEQVRLINKTHDEAVRLLEEAQREAESLKRSYERLDTFRQEHSALSASLDRKKNRTEEIARQVKFLEGERKRLVALYSERFTWWEASGKPNPQDLQKEEAKRIKKLRTQFERMEQQLDVDQQKVKELQNERRLEVMHLKQLVDEQERRVGSLKKLKSEGECPTCGQTLGKNYESILLDGATGLVALRAKLSDQEEQLNASQTEPDGLREKSTLVQEARDEMRSAEERQHQLQGFVSALASIERIDMDLRSLRNELAALDEELALLRKKLVALPFSQEDYVRTKGKYEAASSLLELHRLKRLKLEGELNVKRAMGERTKAELLAYDGRAEELSVLRRDVLLFDESDKVLTDFRKYLNAGIRPTLSAVASEFLAELTDGRYTSVHIGDDFQATVLDEGEAKPVISGGEEDIVNLCLRLALSQMLADRAGQSFSLLILDEVFGSLDQERRNNVLLLLERISQRFEQILLITHLDDIKEGVHHLLYLDYDEVHAETRLADNDVESLEVMNL